MEIQVTQKNIDEGIPNNCVQCPVALAFKDMGYKHVIVWSSFIQVVGANYRIDDAGYNFIKRFDAHLPVEPLTIKLERVA